MSIKLLTVAIACALTTGCALQPEQTALGNSSPQATPVSKAATEALTSPKPQITYPKQKSEASSGEIYLDPVGIEENADLWQELRNGMALVGEYQHPRLDKQLKWYASHQRYFDRVFERAEPYLYYIISEIKASELPLELALLPVVESAYDPFAYSHSHAAGLWQFIPGTANRFGLERNWWYEGRRDVVASTQAAIDYLTYLHGIFDGDWLLALAAYNSGEGTVRRAIRKNLKKGLPTDFWSLTLPAETRAYVPQLLAVATIVSDPEQFGIQLAAMPLSPYFEAVECDAQIDLNQAAQMAGIDVEEIYRLNPAYNRWTTAPGASHTLLLPIDSAATFRNALATVPKEQWVATSEYRVKSGDTLSQIARKHSVTTSDLRKENKLSKDLIRIGQVLRIPGGGNFTSISANNGSYYQVASGDSLWEIARKHNVSVKDLRAWNNLATNELIRPGQQLQVSQQKPFSVNRKMKYRVKRGDSLSRIASNFNVTVKDIVGWNKISPTHYLKPGQKLTLFVDIRKM